MAYDLISATKAYKAGLYSLFLDFEHWSKFTTRYGLDWRKVRFNDANRDDVPNVPGLYAFSISLTPSKIPPHSYILYIGESGDGDSMATLQKRYGNYLSYQRNGTAGPRVAYMLEEWRDHLFFCFSALPRPDAEIRKLESKLLTAMIPPVNQKDFEAHVSGPRRAAF